MRAPSPKNRISPRIGHSPSDRIGHKLGLAVAIAASAGLLSGCMGAMPTPMAALNRQLAMAGTNRAPSLSGRWLAVITGRGGRDQVLLLDVAGNAPVPVPGLNRGDAQPISVGVDTSGERLALVRQLEGRTELVLYRRSLMSLQPIPMQPAGVPSQVTMRADGKELAVQVSREGLWQIDLIALP
jgi:hypothetical protein